jgi:replication factor C subunit 1
MELWVDKYTPKKVNQFLGNGYSIKKVMSWIREFSVDQKSKILLLIGNPGVGKTTAVKAVSERLGYTLKEFNASDTRSAKMIKGLLFDNTSLVGYFSGKKPTVNKKQIILMDEVDGMSPAGMTELIKLSKSAKHPIVCICNVETTSVRKLSQKSTKIRFYPVPYEKIVSRMQVILHHEKQSVPKDVVNQVVKSCNGDVRKTINKLQFLCTGGCGHVTPDNDNEFQVSNDTIFNTVGSLITNRNALEIDDTLQYHFTDTLMIPLFLQENYPRAISTGRSRTTLENMVNVSDSISLGDTVNTKIMKDQQHTLMPFNGILSTVVPVYHYQKGLDRLTFPTLLGKMSTLNKNQNQNSQLRNKMSKKGIGNLDQSEREMIAKIYLAPLIAEGKEGIPKVFEFLKAYNLHIDDFKQLIDSANIDYATTVDSKVKSALTRAYKKRKKKN